MAGNFGGKIFWWIAENMVIYECDSAVDLSNFTDEQLRGGPCYTDPSVLPLTTCLIRGSVVAAWAVGGEVSSLCTSGSMLIGYNTIYCSCIIINIYIYTNIAESRIECDYRPRFARYAHAAWQ